MPQDFKCDHIFLHGVTSPGNQRKGGFELGGGLLPIPNEPDNDHPLLNLALSVIAGGAVNKASGVWTSMWGLTTRNTEGRARDTSHTAPGRLQTAPQTPSEACGWRQTSDWHNGPETPRDGVDSLSASAWNRGTSGKPWGQRTRKTFVLQEKLSGFLSSGVLGGDACGRWWAQGGRTPPNFFNVRQLKDRKSSVEIS